MLRKRCGLSLRQLAELAGVTAGIISSIERGKTSPSIATLQKILSALSSDLASFFGNSEDDSQGPFLLRERMQVISDVIHSYTIIFPKRRDVKVEMLDEYCYPSLKRPPFEKVKCDVAGYILSGGMVLEIQGGPKKTLRPGDAFYVPKDQRHRGYVAKDQPARLITVYSPTKY